MDPFAIGRTYLQVKHTLEIQTPDVDPVIYLEKISQGIQWDENPHSILNQAAKLIELAKLKSLDTGRKPEPLARAALCFLVMYYKRIDINAAIKIVGPNHSDRLLVRTRFQELKYVLMRLKNELPWAKDITENNLIRYIPDIIDFYWILKGRDEFKSRLATSKSTPPTNPSSSSVTTTPTTPTTPTSATNVATTTTPPSTATIPTNTLQEQQQESEVVEPELEGPPAFARLEKRRREWLEQVKKASQHLQTIKSGSGQTDFTLTEDEILIQRMMLNGFSLERIEELLPKSTFELNQICLKADLEQAEKKKRIRLDDSDLSDADFSDGEMESYISSQPSKRIRMQKE